MDERLKEKNIRKEKTKMNINIDANRVCILVYVLAWIVVCILFSLGGLQ